MYTALYRTERPEVFDEVLGQEHIVKILRNQVKNGSVGHAYLFSGTRGTGKTSVARILAKAMNCTGDVAEGDKPCGKCPNCLAIQNGNFMDVIEIDAASNNGVDTVRELRESINYPPSVGRKKVYIIDEAHELSPRALNALLKTLEEPPEDVMFILATTDPQKLLQTILSRCLRLDFHRVSERDLKGHMHNIGKKRGVEISDEALNLLAANADGSVRDALSLLDQCMAGVTEGVLDRDMVLDYLGTASEEFFIRLTEFTRLGDVGGALVTLEEVLREGKDVKQIMADWLRHFRSLLVGKYIDTPEDMLNMSGENVARLAKQAKAMELPEINRGIMTLAKTINDARYSPQPRILMELAIVSLASGECETPQASAVQVQAPKRPSKPAAAQQSSKPASTPTSPKPEPQQSESPKAEPQQSESPKPEPQQSESPTQEPEGTPAPEAVFSNEEPSPIENPTDGMDELSEIWASVWDNIDEIGSVTMVRVNSTLAGIGEEEFKLFISSDITSSIAERNREMIEEAMEKVVGRHLKMVIKRVEEKVVETQQTMMDGLNLQREDEEIWDESPEEKTEESIKEELESKLNIKLRIEE